MIQIFHCIRSEMLPGSRESRLYDVRTGRYDLWSGRRVGEPDRRSVPNGWDARNAMTAGLTGAAAPYYGLGVGRPNRSAILTNSAREPARIFSITWWR